MNVVAKLALAAWFSQWLGTECAVVNQPIRETLIDKLEHQISVRPEHDRKRYWAEWALYGIDCPTCRGVWGTLILGRLTGATLLDIVAANALHYALLTQFGDGCEEG